jgi:5-formyltetrahydrofolate cyclo-ligase
MKKILARLDERWLTVASREVSEQLTTILDVDIPQEIEHILAWVSHFPGEVDLSEFISEQLDKRSVYLPRSLADRSMSFVSVGKDWVNSMESGHFGIPEPSSETGVLYDFANAPQTVVIVPGLAFDATGNRVGRGGGYYDRFLARAGMQPAIKIGVCFSLQMIPKVPSRSHDITMDWVCHERAALRTSLDYDDRYDE